MERTVTATQARVRFGEMMRRVVEDEEAIIVERGGEPQVVLISVEQYEQFKTRYAAEPSWEVMLDEVHQLLDRELGGRELPPAEEIVRQMREERDAHLQGLLH